MLFRFLFFFVSCAFSNCGCFRRTCQLFLDCRFLSLFVSRCLSWFLVFLEITRALIPVLALWLNRAYPVPFGLAPFRSVLLALFTRFWPAPVSSSLLLRLPFRCILPAKFNLPFFALKSLGCVRPKRDEVARRRARRTAFGFTFSLFLIYFSFYALLRLQLPPANFDPPLLQFLYFILFYFFHYLGSVWFLFFFFGRPNRDGWRCHLKLSDAVSQ